MTTINIKDGDGTYAFEHDSDQAAARAHSLLSKEPGTIEWIRGFGREDVFYDVGANVGVYTVFAAPRVDHVYAFEPHLGNAFSLLRNVRANGLTNVTVIASALSDRSGFFALQYQSLEIGTGNNQVRERSDRATGADLSECKHCTTLDALIEGGIVRPASRIKIDVDGNEPLVLRGMQGLLERCPPRSLLVEYNPSTGSGIEDYLGTFGFGLRERQLTRSGRKAHERGIPMARIAHNCLFLPRGCDPAARSISRPHRS